MGVRRKARELALQAMFQSEFTKKPTLEQLTLLVENFQVNKKALPYAVAILEGIADHMVEIDQLIAKHAENWRLDRMSPVDRNIIRIAVYELIYCKDVPETVSINEAIEIAKKFSTNDAKSFINGILDAIVKSKTPTVANGQGKN